MFPRVKTFRYPRARYSGKVPKVRVSDLINRLISVIE